MTTTNPHPPIPTIALVLGAGGLIPFLVLAFALALKPDLFALGERAMHMMLVTYAALIASFLGGVRWGNALKDHQIQTREMIIAIIPTLVAWAALATPRPFDLVLLIGLFLALAVSDIGLVTLGHAPRWYGRLRVALSIGVVASLIIALFASAGLHRPDQILIGKQTVAPDLVDAIRAKCEDRSI